MACCCWPGPLIRAAAVGQKLLVAATAVGVLAIVTAAFNGLPVLATGDDQASMVMAVAAGVATVAYLVVLARGAEHRSEAGQG